MNNSNAVKVMTGIVIFLFVMQVMSVYLKSLDAAMKEDIIVTLNEIGSHDIKSIEKEVQNCWDVLEGISEDFVREPCETISEVQTKLVRNRTAASLRYVYLIDGEGKLYTDNPLIRNGNDHDFLSFFDKYGSKFVTRYDRRDDKHHLAELEKELVLYGMEITPFTAEDAEFTKILGMYDVSAIREGFNIKSFNDRGYSTVIELDGDYVVDPDETSVLGQIPNFFEMLADGELEDSDMDTVRKKICGRDL